MENQLDAFMELKTTGSRTSPESMAATDPEERPSPPRPGTMVRPHSVQTIESRPIKLAGPPSYHALPPLSQRRCFDGILPAGAPRLRRVGFAQATAPAPAPPAPDRRAGAALRLDFSRDVWEQA